MVRKGKMTKEEWLNSKMIVEVANWREGQEFLKSIGVENPHDFRHRETSCLLCPDRNNYTYSSSWNMVNENYSRTYFQSKYSNKKDWPTIKYSQLFKKNKLFIW